MMINDDDIDGDGNDDVNRLDDNKIMIMMTWMVMAMTFDDDTHISHCFVD